MSDHNMQWRLQTRILEKILFQTKGQGVLEGVYLPRKLFLPGDRQKRIDYGLAVLPPEREMYSA